MVIRGSSARPPGSVGRMLSEAHLAFFSLEVASPPNAGADPDDDNTDDYYNSHDDPP